MITILFFVALLPWAIAQTTSLNLAIPLSNPTVSLQSPGTVTSCQLANITWSTYLDAQVPFTINYTNEGAGETVATVISGVATAVTNPSVYVIGWRVNVPTSGRYILTGRGVGVDILSSDPFTVAVSDTSCFNSTTTASTAIPAKIIATSSVSSSVSSKTPSRSLSASLAASATSLAGTDPSVVPVGGNGNDSKLTTMVGTILGSLVFVALLAAIFFYRRHRLLKTYANSKPEKPKGHRKWGGIQSVDSNF